MKYMWTLFVIIPLVAIAIIFPLSQKYKSTFVPPSPTQAPTNTQSATFCKPTDLETNVMTEGAAGNIYGTLTMKNISTNTCTIQGNNFIEPTYSVENIVVSPLGKSGPEKVNLSPNQIVYAQIHYPNGPQCSGGIMQTPIKFLYKISSKDAVVFSPRGSQSSINITTCKSTNEMTKLDVSSISLKTLE